MRRRLRQTRQLPLVLGLVDGIMNALALAAGTILRGGGEIGLELALRIGAFSLATAAFVLFVARYAELRADLVRISRQLNLTEHGRLAATRLGRQVLADAFADGAKGSLASCFGALAPLLIAAAIPEASWVALVAALAMLVALGIALARTLRANPFYWSVALAVGGGVVAGVGVELQIA